MKKEIRKRIQNILCISIFLILYTWFIFGPREELIYLTANINNQKTSQNDIIILNDQTLNINDHTYSFKIKNTTNEKKEYSLLLINDMTKSIMKECKVMSNNFIRYQLNKEEEKKNLSLSGILYKEDINPYETKELSIKLSKSDQLKEKYCYYPKLKINIE